ncbi:uncharacterized protein FFB20_03610 [Fusarium fujikuroi]|nr:uncharacterized protein FFB20_03610 [Fusarium fujikuroi]SCN73456.1 uncharacterized protein FFC1_01795 [Fusarium fujikuroi]SCO07797.1 uncharacterized protein FFE2_11370 [Fusarium fujikuroi]SCO11735.1 uncharacterized protein FFM5_10097 [Fusarium fujikuroi]SCO27554.1 uncharacterized protein FFMR_00434 [Fusarium fujikuroi]
MYGYRINAFEALAEPGEAQKVMTVSFAAVGDDLYEDESACLPSSARAPPEPVTCPPQAQTSLSGNP